ncbi:MAG: c-type cytochrome [Acidobacteriota bacterium]|nr:c-type cytochrome [Acidobacteriota bacterium]MDH3783742.1 c-type cytochrome [Acidobacteriota bacterium]
MANEDKQRDRLLDHNYDGIQEYDNPMPAWWIWLFVLPVLFAYPYILHYHFGSGPSIHDKLDKEIAAYANQLLATYGELAPDRKTILSFRTDETAMTGMSSLFRGRCAQCHLADGSGNVGPNLTDDHWKNVTTVTDIPGLIRDGLPVQGMPAWGDRLTETQIVLLSSYVARLRDQPVAGKNPEGDPIPPWDEIPAEVP